MEASTSNGQCKEVAEGEEDEMWIWKELLARVQKRISQLDKRLDKKVKIYQGAQNRINEYRRIQEQQPDNNFDPLQMARIIVLATSAINLSGELAKNIADYSKECSQIRKKLGFLEEQLNRGGNDKGIGNDKGLDPLQVALDYMSHVDKFLNQIFQWDEEIEAQQ